MGLHGLEELTLDSNRSPNEYDALALTTMSSGHLCVNLSENVSWEGFPAFADALLKRIRGTRTRTTEGVDVRLWDVVIDGQNVQLLFDDFPTMVSLESRDARGDEVLRRVHDQLEGGS